MSEQLKHTPGPWNVGPHYKGDVESREGRVCECGPFGSPRSWANAHLIAAAPEMYEALQRARTFIAYARYELEPGELQLGDQFPRQGCADKEIARIEAAITKAEGRQP